MTLSLLPVNVREFNYCSKGWVQTHPAPSFISWKGRRADGGVSVQSTITENKYLRSLNFETEINTVPTGIPASYFHIDYCLLFPAYMPNELTSDNAESDHSLQLLSLLFQLNAAFPVTAVGVFFETREAWRGSRDLSIWVNINSIFWN